MTAGTDAGDGVGCLPGRWQEWVGQSKRLAEKREVGDAERDLCSVGVGNSVTSMFFFQTQETPQLLGGLFAAVITHPRRGFCRIADAVGCVRGGP